jgi:hypothetical protein
VRRTKLMVVAVAMALALTAFAAASASAAIFEVSEAGSASVTKWNGALTGGFAGTPHKLKLGGETFSCDHVANSGEMVGKSTAALTVTPELKNCLWIGSSGYSWQMNGCKYSFNAGTGSKNPTTGTMDIVGCESPMKFAVAGCELEIGNQSGLGPVTYTSSETGGLRSVKIAANVTGLKYTRISGPSCSEKKSGTFTNGSYTGEWTTTPAHFVTEALPAEIRSKDESKVFTFPEIGSLTCSEFGPSGPMGSLQAESLTLRPASTSGCISMSDPVTLSMGGCSFKFTGSGGFQIVGATCASSPITITDSTVPGGCVVTVGPTAPLSGLLVTGEGTGAGRSVTVSGLNPHNVVGLEYTLAGAHCNSIKGAGTYTDGVYKDGLTLSSHTSAVGSQGLWIE